MLYVGLSKRRNQGLRSAVVQESYKAVADGREGFTVFFGAEKEPSSTVPIPLVSCGPWSAMREEQAEGKASSGRNGKDQSARKSSGIHEGRKWSHAEVAVRTVTSTLVS